MPKKAQKTSKEEKLAENLFPIDETSLKHAIQKEYKPLASETIIETHEKPTIPKKQNKKYYPQRSRTKSTRRGGRVGIGSSKRKSSKILKKFTHPKINLKKGGYELIITEKPQAAGKIAAALGNATKRDLNKVPYYELTKDGKELVVACTVGHLLTLKQNLPGYSVPIFDIGWVPNSFVKKSDFTKKYYNTLSKLAKDAGSVTVATDYDVEGEVIGLNAVRFICGQKDANRMKFSTLTPVELNKAYKNKTKTLNWGQAIAGETRHYLDWFYGINLSRALMNAIKSTGKFRIMSVGRIQGPTLNLIVQKEREIQKFKPETYWQVFIKIKNSHILELKHNKDIFNKSELEKFEQLNGKTVQAKTTKREQIFPPNTPFNLTSLQMESYKFHGLTPAQTLRVAQSLYLSGVISYPRTSSQQLPESIDYKSILKKLAKKYNVESLIKRQKPIQGKKSDPAHPSIYPTGQNPSALSTDEEKIYNLIVKRFLALFCENAIVDNKTISVTTDKLTFSARGSSIRKKAWMEIYPVKLKEQELPDIEGEVKIINVRTEEKQTQPPRRYTAASIVSELEKRNLGTKATRANIIETLYNRNYIKEKSIEATPLGMSLITTLEKYSPIIINEELTRDLEKETEAIAGTENKANADRVGAVGTAKANKELLEKEKKVIDQAKKTITEISEHFNKSENKIGNELLDANMQLREQEREANKLTTCPICNKGELAITYSRKTRKHFIACNAYPDCKTTYSLPPNSLIKKTDKVCDKCGFPMLMSLKKGKRPWFFCFNDKCETNRERIEEYRKKKAEEENAAQ
jgi:DNA topoisomerase I